MVDREAGNDPAATEVEALFAVVRARYGARLDAEQLEGVRKGIEAAVEAARLVRAVRLVNSDEPYQSFRPYRADEAPRP